MSPYYRFAPLYDETQFHVGENISNVTGCPSGVQWIWTVMGDCVITPREQASAYLGISSMGLWMLVSIPQIVKNFRNIDGLAGLSFFLLFQWAGGDITNLIGSFLTNQLKPQIYLAAYFVASDIVLLLQYAVFIVRRYKRRKAEAQAAADPTPRLILCLMGVLVFSNTLLSQMFTSSSVISSMMASGLVENQHIRVGRLSRSLLSASEDSNALIFQPEREVGFHIGGDGVVGDGLSSGMNGTGAGPPVFWHNKTDIIGYVIGIISSIFYLGSRSAQIYRNVKAQSTDGLALLTFLLAVLGNLTYGCQILVRDLSTEFLLEKTPWLVGSLGVIGLDCTLLVQFRYYSRKHGNLEELHQRLLTKDYIINAGSGSMDSSDGIY